VALIALTAWTYYVNENLIVLPIFLNYFIKAFIVTLFWVASKTIFEKLFNIRKSERLIENNDSLGSGNSESSNAFVELENKTNKVDKILTIVLYGLMAIVFIMMVYAIYTII
jgi:hypothetical protein